MPKVVASMADVSTEFTLADPATYRLQVTSVDYQTKDAKNENGQDIKRGTYIVKSKIIASYPDGETEFANKPIYDYINIHNKNGELNEISLGNLKRYFEAIAPDSADSEDADTDELVNGFFIADVYIDSYPTGKKNADGSDETRQSNKIKYTSISPDQ